MKILVAGGNGQLGRSLQKVVGEFAAHDFVFVGLPQLDITDRKSVERIVEEQRPDAIINCAAYTAVDRAESDAELAERVNAWGAQVVAEVAAERGLKLVHISTDYVFDGSLALGRAYVESDAVNPQNVYGRTKLAGEYAVGCSGANAAIVRTAWLYSEFGDNFVKTMLRLGREREVVEVVDDQFGSPTYATDLARAIVVLLERGFEGCELYHYVNSGCVSRYEFVEEIFKLAGIGAELRAVGTERFPTPAVRPANSALDTTKINSIATVYCWKYALDKFMCEMGII